MAGLRVVELAVWIAGPAAGGILADWGADVIKIEPPQGDPSRKFEQLLGAVLPSNPIFEQDNRSKRSIVLDLADDDELSIAFDLIAEADVFVTNIRGAGLRRLGLDYETLADRFPRLVYAHVTGYGRSGPDADRPAFDIAAFWARGGIANLLTTPGQAPPAQRGGMGDHNTGLAAAAAISAALYEREKSGHGQLISTSLLREGAYTISFDLNTKLMWGADLTPVHRSHASAPTTNSYELADGKWVWITGIDPVRYWPPMCRVLGLDELIEDPRYADPVLRRENGPELIATLDARFAELDSAEWRRRTAEEPDLVWAPLNTLDDLLADPQLDGAGVIVEVPDSDGSTTPMVATPADFSRTPAQPRSLAPKLGEHREEILAELAELRTKS